MGHTVLVVEDSPSLNDLLTEALQGEGYECAQALDGAEALESLERKAPDAVVLDLNIPKVHGLEVLRAVKARRPFSTVIVLTGHGSEQTALQALKLGADDYLTKPCRQSQLLESLQSHLQRADLQSCLDFQGVCLTHEEERRLARMFFEAPAALVHADGSGIIRAVNRAAATLLARQPDELLGSPLSRIVAEDVRAGWMQSVRQEAANPKGYEGEVHVFRPGGSFPANVLAVAGPEEGQLILALKDLTRQKAMEKHYFESKRLASLGRVVEGVAHEVRNPLISIGGFARKLRGRVESSAREARYLKVILDEVERLEKMVHDIEEFVQFSSRNRSSFGPVDLREIVAASVGEVAEKAGDERIEVDYRPPEEAPNIFADPSLMGELFRGLLENACEAMPSGGKLQVEFGVVDGWVRVHVRDTGVGIPEEDLEEIFDPFFTSKTSGAGLGLAKAYLIVEEHSGTIDFESKLGEGTECTVSLPVDRRRVQRTPA